MSTIGGAAHPARAMTEQEEKWLQAELIRVSCGKDAMPLSIQPDLLGTAEYRRTAASSRHIASVQGILSVLRKLPAGCGDEAAFEALEHQRLAGRLRAWPESNPVILQLFDRVRFNGASVRITALRKGTELDAATWGDVWNCPQAYDIRVSDGVREISARAEDLAPLKPVTGVDKLRLTALRRVLGAARASLSKVYYSRTPCSADIADHSRYLDAVRSCLQEERVTAANGPTDPQSIERRHLKVRERGISGFRSRLLVSADGNWTFNNAYHEARDLLKDEGYAIRGRLWVIKSAEMSRHAAPGGLR